MKRHGKGEASLPVFSWRSVGHFVRKRQHPGPAIGSRRCLDEELCSDRPYRKPRSYIPQGILLLVWSVKTLSAVERAF